MIPENRSLFESAFDLPGLRHIPKFAQPWLAAGANLLFLLLIYWLTRLIVGRVIKRTATVVAAREEAAGNHGRAARVRTLASLARSVVNYALAFIFLVAALGTIGINVAGVIGTAGVAGLAVGFGAQKLVKDVISGFFLLLEDQYAVGDYVTIGGVTGTVQELGMRITRLRDEDGRLFILANGDIGQVCNMSRGALAGVVEIGIAATADVAAATEVLDAALAPHQAKVEGVAAADATKTVLRVRFQTEMGKRPADAALPIRQIARDALLAAQIALA